MKTKAVPKIHAVYEFFLKEGFQHTVEEVAEAVNVTPKTLFNRYQTKANMEYEVRQYWHKLLFDRLNKKAFYCNNAVEKMILLTCEPLYCLRQETNFFMKELENFFSFEKNAFYLCLHLFLKEGQEMLLFNNDINSHEYVSFFMHNLFSFLPDHPNADTVFNLLSPVLLPESQAIYNQIDIDKIIHQ